MCDAEAPASLGEASVARLHVEDPRLDSVLRQALSLLVALMCGGMWAFWGLLITASGVSTLAGIQAGAFMTLEWWVALRVALFELPAMRADRE